MHIQDILKHGRTALSFEFFPPRHAEGMGKLLATVRRLRQFQPDFVSVTYGAGGATREFTWQAVERLQREEALNIIPHLTSLGHSRAEVRALLERYAASGVANILALRGDPPISGSARTGDFAYAVELVAEIRRFTGHHEPRGFGIGVAGFPEGHPGTPNRLLELEHLKAKVDAGADYICTQLFFDNADFFDFRERCELAGIRVPVIAGVMPLTSLANLRRIAELAGGARFPARLLRRLQRCAGDEAAVRQAGLEYATEQCAELRQAGVAGLHFYTLNQAEAAETILSGLGYTRQMKIGEMMLANGF